MAPTIEKHRAKSRSSAASRYEPPFELPEYLVDQVREKAHALWKQRGCREGHALEDWFEAERIVMETVK